MTLTQILQKIKSAFYTKSETESKLNTKANSSDLNNYLPLSGGQMSGVIARSVNDDKLFLKGSPGVNDGSHLELCGKNYTINPGGFYIRTKNDSNDKWLAGYANGTLTWDNKNIDVIEEQGDGYIRYSNGLQICWGSKANDNALGTGVFSTAYPKAFNSYPRTICTPISWGGAYSAVLRGDSSNTNVVLSFLRSSEPSGDGVNVYYIAIGTWK